MSAWPRLKKYKRVVGFTLCARARGYIFICVCVIYPDKNLKKFKWTPFKIFKTLPTQSYIE